MAVSVGAGTSALLARESETSALAVDPSEGTARTSEASELAADPSRTSAGVMGEPPAASMPPDGGAEASSDPPGGIGPGTVVVAPLDPQPATAAMAQHAAKMIDARTPRIIRAREHRAPEKRC
jgi:hypothetical protein